MALDLSPLARTREWIACGILPPAPDVPLASRMMDAARRQGIAGLLAAAVRVADDWPADVCQDLRRTERALVARGIRHLDLAARVHRDLLERGLRTLPLKGAAVSELLYDSPAERAMGDVDLLALDDWDTCERALAERGFARLAAGDHAAQLRDPDTGLTLELHVSVVSCPGLFPLDAEGLWKRSRSAGGQVPRVPAPEDLLLHLALHTAFQHGLVLTLGQHLDLRRVVERLPLDPDRLLARAREARALPALAAALRAAEIVVGLDLPPLLAPLVRQHLPRPLARWLDERSACPLALVVPSPPALARTRLALSGSRRLALLRRTLLARPVGSRLSAGRRLGYLLRRALRLAFSDRAASGPPGSPSA